MGLTAMTDASRGAAACSSPACTGAGLACRAAILLLTRMPNADEAVTLRSYVGLRQTRNVGPDHCYWLHRKAI